MTTADLIAFGKDSGEIDLFEVDGWRTASDSTVNLAAEMTKDLRPRQDETMTRTID